ncbi:SAM-dependent methyltransferase TRM5/TYW2-type [Phytophthora cactorum]|nr:SAM-dependent methyltransferase TRM5/TYW2-type [Phytophthora cactorum]
MKLEFEEMDFRAKFLWQKTTLRECSMLRRTLQVVGVRVEASKAGKVIKKLQNHLLNLPKLRNVVPDLASERMKLILLSTDVRSPEALQPLREQLAALLRANSFSFVPHAVQIDCTEDASDRGAETKNRRGERPGLNKFKTPIGNVSFRPVDTVNVQQLHDINEKLFPVKYNNAFYEYVTDAPEGYCKLGTLPYYGEYVSEGRDLSDSLFAAYADDKTAVGAPLLDKTLFKKTLEVVGVRVEAKKIGRVVKKLHGHLLNLPRLRNVVPDPTNPDPYKNSSSKLILLNSKVKDTETLQPLNEDLVTFLKEESLAFVSHAIELDYSYFAVDQVLSELLPQGMDIPSSFETVGHIAHLNLRDNQLPYKNVIGQVILDKNAQIRTVVNKTDNIETKFRTFPMERSIGTRVCSRNTCVSSSDKPHDVVCDMMCGIGPFAIPLALNGSKVYANDLNPRSYHYLKENIVLNKVEKLVTAYNLDGREFLAKLLSEKKQFTQVLMNLPAIALEFLDAFPGQFDHWEGELPKCCTHLISVVLQRAEKIMGGELDPKRTSFHLVRDVAPKKVMVCISFQLPESIAFSSERQASKQDDPKRRKVETETDA